MEAKDPWYAGPDQVSAATGFLFQSEYDTISALAKTQAIRSAGAVHHYHRNDKSRNAGWRGSPTGNSVGEDLWTERIPKPRGLG